MDRWLQSRHNQILLFMLVLMSVLVIRLFSLTVVQNQDWAVAAENNSVKTIHTSAPRGEIRDRYGRLLAGNQPSFTVQITGAGMTSEDINRVASNLLYILNKNNDQYYDKFPIIIDENGSFYYTYQTEIESWLISSGMPSDYTAEQAFNEIRYRNNIEDGLDKYQAQEQLQTSYQIFPPISVKNMKFLEELEKESFLGKHYLDYDLSAKDAFEALRIRYKIQDGMSDADARNMLIVQDALASQGFRGYIPAKIASGVSDRTIIELEERATEFSGLEVVAESVRYYPENSTAAHVIGYLGPISESEKEEYVTEKGYNVNDMIGKTGIEKAYEDVLKGTDGVRTVEVNAHGDLVRVISETPAVKGQDVYLTLDLELQKVAENALNGVMAKIRTGGTYTSPYTTHSFGKAYRNSDVGAAVAIDVETGDVLALSNDPSFDLNLFATGISTEDWASLQAENPRDPLSPLPLFNVATSTAVQPGSTFKPVTATAALASGLDPNMKLYDGGVIRIGEQTIACSIWNSRRGSHGSLNLMEAIEVSCNYYFFDLGSNKNYHTGASLGLDDMNIEKVTQYAQKYGLGVKTGIEIPETVVPVPSAERKMENTRVYLRNVLIGRAELYFTAETVSNKELLNDNINTIVDWTDENPSRNVIIERLESLGLQEDKVTVVADLCKFTYFNQAAWTTVDKLNISIGQGENAYTPLQMANYVATLANDGLRNQVSVVKGIEGQGLNIKPAGEQIDVSEAGFEALQEGMRRVVSGSRGTSRGSFVGFPVSVAGKTGTAERAGKVPPVDEVEYVKQYLSSFNRYLSADKRMTFEQVEVEMARLMNDYPDIYKTRNGAVRQAVINLSGHRITTTILDTYKGTYDNFSWYIGFAPVEDPKIAVAVLLFKGGSGGYAAPVARDIFGKYFEIENYFVDYDVNTHMTQ